MRQRTVESPFPDLFAEAHENMCTLKEEGRRGKGDKTKRRVSEEGMVTEWQHHVHPQMRMHTL